MLGFDNHNGSEPVGYFPSKTVGELRTGAEKVKFGGYIYSKRGDYTSPPLGSRYFSRPPIYDQTCFMIQVAVIYIARISINCATRSCPDCRVSLLL